MDWFRFYHEFSTDPKVQMMPEAYQRRLTMLFCFRCNDDVTLHDEEITFQLRISPEEWAATKAEFIKRLFIDADNNILNWNKRQYVSDSSNQRVKRHREKKKQECNVTVTPPDTEQNQIQSRKETVLENLTPVSAPPDGVADDGPTEIAEGGDKSNKRGERLIALLQREFGNEEIPQAWGQWAYDAPWHMPAEDINQAWDEFLDYWRGIPGQKGCKLDWPATWRNRIRDLTGRRKRKEELNGIYTRKRA